MLLISFYSFSNTNTLLRINFFKTPKPIEDRTLCLAEIIFTVSLVRSTVSFNCPVETNTMIWLHSYCLY